MSRSTSGALGPRVPEVELFGERFELLEVSQWALLEFAEAAGSVDATALTAIAPVMAMLREAIKPEDWARFVATAKTNKAKIEQHLMPIIVEAVQGQQDRPTPRSSDSSPGPLPTPASSGFDSESKAATLAPGRADLQLVIQRAQEFQASA